MTISMPNHYSIEKFCSIDDVHSLFTKDIDYYLNWCFTSTSGVHGHCLTIEQVKKWLLKKQELKLNCFRPGNCDEANCPYSEICCGDTITILIVQPRIVAMKYGNPIITIKDLELLRGYIKKTVLAITHFWQEEIAEVE